ncbi:hypothetical protein [Rhizobium glycinendophyticum]|uniref:Secreted protein n=1 Tax=Rhizobium glycinendophyticum TaxID=2589807 RepID=A0A504V053_9HYPH|nr:hypothetical protein [Rhizobium glycinendophyticum]TPP10782.1 hypothetical protein FJQ55_08050 [Rhizobium glycinendophyticum]
MKRVAVSLLVFLAATSLSRAEDIDQLPVTATFVVSGGFWEGGVDGAPGAKAGDTASASANGRGYYKLVAIRQPDRTARVYLQMIAAEESGPRLVESVELEEFTAIKPYVTGIQPESTSGVSGTPGFMATVYLRTDPTRDPVEEWTVLIDELGDIRVERASN